MRRLSVRLLALLAFLMPTIAAMAPARAAWVAPGFVRSIGGRGEAGVYAWGIQWNPVSNEMLVGDYWNFKVRRYNPATGAELGAFFRPPSLRKGQPYSLAVDPRNGDIWVPEISDGKASGYIAHYDKVGNYIGEIHINARYEAWIHIDANGLLYVNDSHYWNQNTDPPWIRVYTLNGTLIRSIDPLGYGNGPGQMGILHGIDTDSAGRIFADDAVNRNVHVYSSTGTWLYDFGSQGSGVGQFTGDLRGLAIDKVHGWVYVVDAEAGEIEKFDLSGNPISHWGSVGQGPGQFADGGRQLTIDGSGNVWVADYGNFRFFEYDPNGVLLATYPDPAQQPPPGNFSQDRDVAIDPSGNVWAADSWNDRFQEFASDGTFLHTWGIRNSDPPYGMDYPRGVGIDPTNGNVWVASTRDHFIREYDNAGNYIQQIGDGIDSAGTGSFRWPMDIQFFGGKVYVGDYNSGRVKILDPTTGQELKSISITNNGIAVDPATGNWYVLSWSTDKITEYNPTFTSVIRTFGSRGSGAGQLQSGWGIDVVNGQIYVTDSVLARVDVWTLTGGWVGMWGSNGTGAFQFNNPSGIAHDAAGNIYVADAGNDRIQVFSASVPPPSGDTVVPTATITSPVANQELPPTTVVVTGGVADNLGIGKVEVAVRRNSDMMWWNGKDAIWGTAKTWNLSAMTLPTRTAGTYAYSFIGEGYSQSFFAQTRATDTSGNSMSVYPSVKFSTSSGSSDTTAPSTTIEQPTLDQILPPGPVSISGNAIDDSSGVASVDIAIKDRVSLLWWDPVSNGWVSGLKWIGVTLATPGALYTNWSYVWSGASSGGSYFVQARSTDGAGNVDTSKPFTRFTVS